MLVDKINSNNINSKESKHRQFQAKKKDQNLKFNMRNHLVEYDKKNHCWTWSKWDYKKDWEGKSRVIRRLGTLEFMKMFPTVFPNKLKTQGIGKISGREQMEVNLEKWGIDFVFLHQGDTLEEKEFKNIEEAEKSHRLESYPQWDLTEFWFAFDWDIKSWAMYDTFSGKLQFTPKDIMTPIMTPLPFPKKKHQQQALSIH